jgi:hypothetical protein
MKLSSIVAALAAAATFGVLALATPAAAETIAANTGVVADLVAPMPAAGSEFNGEQSADLTTYAPDGRVDLSPLLEGVLSLLATALLGATAAITAAVNKVLNRNADAKRAEMIAEWTERAVQAAANYVEGAAIGPDGKPREVSFPVAQAWVERALEQSIALFGGMLKPVGGEDAQRRRIWSLMRLPANEHVAFMAPVVLRPVELQTTSPVAPVAPAAAS